MAPRFEIGAGELLLITVEWTGGIHRGTRNTLELDIRAYTRADIEDIIADTTSETCRVASIDRYDIGQRIGEDISEAFDLTTPEDRRATRLRREEAGLHRPLLSAFDRRQEARLREMAHG